MGMLLCPRFCCRGWGILLGFAGRLFWRKTFWPRINTDNKRHTAPTAFDVTVFGFQPRMSGPVTRRDENGGMVCCGAASEDRSERKGRGRALFPAPLQTHLSRPPRAVHAHPDYARMQYSIFKDPA